MNELPEKLKADLLRAKEYRRKWQDFQTKAHKLHLQIIKKLHKRGWSFREMAPELGISAQRIGQLFKQNEL